MDGPSPESPTYIVSFVFKKLFELVIYSYCVVCWQRQKWQLESLMLQYIKKKLWDMLNNQKQILKKYDCYITSYEIIAYEKKKLLCTAILLLDTGFKILFLVTTYVVH
jgi:hypothetical protein